MFHRIRRTVSPIRQRYLRKGRHRRPATLVRPLAASPGGTHGAPLHLRQRQKHTGIRVGEETALVRPYALASEERARHCSAAVSCPPFAGPWFVPAGEH